MSAPAARANLASLTGDFRRHRNETAVVTHAGVRRQSTTYGALANMAARFAAELDRRGISKGDRVVLRGENGATWLAAFFGCLMRGVVAVPLDVAGSDGFARRVALDTGAKLAVTSRPLEGVPNVPLDPLPLADSSAGIDDSIRATDPFQIIFTSGTTGEPKGVVHTHRNVLASLIPIETEIAKYRKYERLFHPLRFLHTLPLSHVFGQFLGIWIPALIAAEVHFESRLIASELIPYVRRSRISVVACVPRLLDLFRSHLLENIPGLDRRVRESAGASVWKRWWLFRDVHSLFGWKFWAFVCGGATLSSDIEQFWNALGFAVIQGYGMTETAALVSLNHPFHQARGSIGKVLPGREVRLTEDGEILVRGETVSTATWESGSARGRESEWLPTGDLASIDEQGNLHYRGRKKEVIVTSAGWNVYPEDLEAALRLQPGVRSCTVIEAEGPTGPEPLAVLILRPGTDAESVVVSANRELSEFQQVHRWTIWPEPDFPRNSAGKIVRREVARQVSGGHQHGALPALLERVTGLQDLRDETLLGLDSLARVELQTSLEAQFGIHLPDFEWQSIRTVGQLRSLLTTDLPSAHSVHVDLHRYPTWPWNPVQTIIRASFLEAIVRPLVWLLATPKVESSLVRLPDGPVLIVSNHVTAFDVPLILYSLPGPLRRRTSVAMGAELLLDMREGRGTGNRWLDFLSPIGYWLISALFNVFPLPQKSGFRAAFDHAGRAMDAGFHVIVFPEGRRTDDLDMHEFQTGTGILWQSLQCPAIPVYLDGLAALKRAGGGWFRSGRITVRVGRMVAGSRSVDPRESALELERAVLALSSSPRSQE